MANTPLIEQAEIPVLATREDATSSLKTILIAEAGERHWERQMRSAAQSDDLESVAEAREKLLTAVKAKLLHQAAYAVWRQNVRPPSRQDPRLRGRRAGGAEQRPPLPATDPGQDMIDRWRKRLCEKQVDRWVRDDDKLLIALEDARHRCQRVVEQQNANTIRGTEGTGEFERYTPFEFIEAARTVLGEIDLDPASSTLAQETVRAGCYFTENDDGLAQEWWGRVFLNPPYHRELAPRFINKLLAELDAERTIAAILLTNNSTDTQWFRLAARQCDCICFTSGRIHFAVPGRDPVLPTQGQAFFYFGPHWDRFIDVFQPTIRRPTENIQDIGFCVRPIDG